MTGQICYFSAYYMGCCCATSNKTFDESLIFLSSFFSKQNSSMQPQHAQAAQVHPAFKNRKPSRRKRGHGETLHVSRVPCVTRDRPPPGLCTGSTASCSKHGSSVKAPPCRRAVAVPPRASAPSAAAVPGLFPPCGHRCAGAAPRLSRSSASSAIGRARAPARRKVCVPELISDPVNRSDYMWPSFIHCLPACLPWSPNPVRCAHA